MIGISNINDIILNLGFITILIGIVIALLQWQRRKIISSLTLGLSLVMVGQVMNGHNEAWLLLIAPPKQNVSKQVIELA